MSAMTYAEHLNARKERVERAIQRKEAALSKMMTRHHDREVKARRRILALQKEQDSEPVIIRGAAKLIKKAR